MDRLQSKSVKIRFDYPFFVEKITPVSPEKCLVQYPCAHTVTSRAGGLFGQMNYLSIEIRSQEDQESIVLRIHTEKKTSVELVENIKNNLAHRQGVDWYSVICSNYGMLHSYSTRIGIEKSRWIPLSGFEDEEI